MKDADPTFPIIFLIVVAVFGAMIFMHASKQAIDKRDYWIQDLQRRIAVLEQKQ